MEHDLGYSKFSNIIKYDLKLNLLKDLLEIIPSDVNGEPDAVIKDLIPRYFNSKHEQIRR